MLFKINWLHNLVSEVRRLRKEGQMKPTPGQIEAIARQKAIDDQQEEDDANADDNEST